MRSTRSRRISVRIKTSLYVSYGFVKDGCPTLTKPLHGKILNLSSSGVLISGTMVSVSKEELLSHGVQIVMSFTLGKDQIFALGKVAWITEGPRGCEFGIYFSEITKQDQDKVLKFVIGKLLKSR